MSVFVDYLQAKGMWHPTPTPAPVGDVLTAFNQYYSVQDPDYSGRQPVITPGSVNTTQERVLTSPKWFGPPAVPTGWINTVPRTPTGWRATADWRKGQTGHALFKWMKSGSVWGVGLVSRYLGEEVNIPGIRQGEITLPSGNKIQGVVPGPWPAPPSNVSDYRILIKFWPVTEFGGLENVLQNGFLDIVPVYSTPIISPNQIPAGATFLQTSYLVNANDFAPNNLPTPDLVASQAAYGTYVPQFYAYITGHVPYAKGGLNPTAADYTPVPANSPIWGGKDPKDAFGVAVGTLTFMLPGGQFISVPFSTGGPYGGALDSGRLEVNILTTTVGAGTRNAGAYGYTSSLPLNQQYNTSWKTGVEISFKDIYVNNTYDQRKQEVIMHGDGNGIGSQGCVSVSTAAGGANGYRTYIDLAATLMKQYIPKWNGNVQIEVAVSTPGVTYYAGRAGEPNKQVSWGYGGSVTPGPNFNTNYFLPNNTLGVYWEPNPIAVTPTNYPVSPGNQDLRIANYVPPGQQEVKNTNLASTNNITTPRSENETIFKWQDGYYVQTTRTEELSQPLGSILAFGGTPGDPWPENVPNNFFNQTYTNTTNSSVTPSRKIEFINKRLD